MARTTRKSAKPAPAAAADDNLGLREAPAVTVISKPLTRKTKAASAKQRKATTDRQDNIPENPLPIDTPVAPQPHPYATRKSNDPHPGISAGLQKRTMQEVQANAARRQAEEIARLAEKEAALLKKREEHDRAVAELAAFEDQLRVERMRVEQEQRQKEAQVVPEEELDADGDLDREMDVNFGPGARDDATSADDFVESGMTDAEMIDAESASEQEMLPPKVDRKAKKTKREQRQEIRGSVENARKTPASKGKRKSDTNADSDKTTKKSKSGSAFVANWRDGVNPLLLQVRQVSNSDLGSSSDSSSALKTNGLGGFTDDDVLVQPTWDGDGQPVNRRVQMVTVKARAPKSTVPEERSMAKQSLPDWARLKWDTALIPSLVEHFGAEPNPWVSSTSGDSFRTTLQSVIDRVYPDEHLSITLNDKVFKMAQQAVYNWRANFARVAKEVVRKDLLARGGGDGPDKRQEIRTFVRDALDDHGYAFWGQPNITNPKQAKDALCSPYILKTFQCHIAATKGSQISCGLPRGGLALTITAVEWVLEMWKTGKYESDGTSFSEVDVGDMTELWVNGSVSTFYRKPHRFEHFLDKANALVKKPQWKVHRCRRSRTAIRDASSPVPEDSDA